MKIYRQKKQWKFLLVLFAAIIGGLSLWYTNKLMDKLSSEEHKRIELWAEATQQLINSSPDQDVSFLFEVLRNNETIPVILVNMEGEILSYRNLDTVKMLDTAYQQKKLNEFMNNGKENFIIKTEDGIPLNKIYYSDSNLLKQLYYYPYIQLALVFLFILVSYFAFNISRKAEQDQVWLGMSKETAHQLGTPISSLMAWLEILKETYSDNPELFKELEKDIKRLEKITDRFSKIGSQPQLSPMNVFEVLEGSLTYMKSRIPQTIKINTEFSLDKNILIPLNPGLFEWVIENLCKNAVDAIGEQGVINISVEKHLNSIFIDVKDTGKGILKKNYKTVFNPGYTTKNRGWGLGLSLVKRIIEQYHQGKVFVKQSEIGVGTTFRIVLKTSD
ncbi:MAG TPA: HAMP domain-containing sensor histidine kinase [Bacteroidales bacterium]|nr:HAMP domain-containing sensor histidine kinase [Bacteroidales bacterium]